MLTQKLKSGKIQAEPKTKYRMKIGPYCNE
mgnify:FL=1|jgi:hypothetical protein